MSISSVPFSSLMGAAVKSDPVVVSGDRVDDLVAPLSSELAAGAVNV